MMSTNYSPPTPPVSPPPIPKETNYTPWLIGCGVVFLLFIFAMIGLSVFLVLDEPEDPFFNEAASTEFEEAAKVKMVNELDPETLKWIKEKKLLNTSENLITYYDMWLDKTEVSILTTERVLYYTNGNITSIPLTEIKEVKKYQREDVETTNDVFVIISQSGKRMKIEMTELEGAEVFERELNDARNKE